MSSYAAHPIMGVFTPDPIGLTLGTRMMRFEATGGVGGLARWDSEKLELLAVHSEIEGKGSFREFIARAKKHFKTICVWHDANPIVGPALSRYGFTPEETIDEFGDYLTGWRWDLPKVSA